MMNGILLLIAAWFLILAETAFIPLLAMEPVAPVFVWLLLPWLAVALRGRSGVVVAAFYGLVSDGLATGPLGPGVILCVVATHALQRSLSDDWPASFVRVAFVTMLTSVIPVILISVATLLTNASRRPVTEALMESVLACAFGALLVSVFVSFARRLQPDRVGRTELV